MSAVTTPTNVSLIQRDASGDNQWIDLLGSANANKAIGFNGSGVLAPVSAALVGAANTFTTLQYISASSSELLRLSRTGGTLDGENQRLRFLAGSTGSSASGFILAHESLTSSVHTPKNYLRFYDDGVSIDNAAAEKVLDVNTTAKSVAVTGNVTARAYVGANVAIAASAIDWATGASFSKTLSANTTFTFLNTASGQSITVAVTNTASNYTVTWPTVTWPGGIAPTQSTGVKTDVYTFKNIGGIIYGSIERGSQQIQYVQTWAQLQAAMAIAATAGGGVIYIDGTIIVPPNNSAFGTGGFDISVPNIVITGPSNGSSVIKLQAGVTYSGFLNFTVNVNDSNITIENITIEGVNNFFLVGGVPTANMPVGIHLARNSSDGNPGITDTVIRNVTFLNSNYAVHLTGGTGSPTNRNLSLINNKVRNCGGGFVLTWGLNGLLMDGNSIIGDGAVFDGTKLSYFNAIYVGKGISNARIVNNYCKDHQRMGIEVFYPFSNLSNVNQGPQANSYGQNDASFIVSNNTIKNVGSMGISFAGARNSIISNNTISDCVFIGLEIVGDDRNQNSQKPDQVVGVLCSNNVIKNVKATPRRPYTLAPTATDYGYSAIPLNPTSVELPPSNAFSNHVALTPATTYATGVKTFDFTAVNSYAGFEVGKQVMLKRTDDFSIYLIGTVTFNDGESITVNATSRNAAENLGAFSFVLSMYGLRTINVPETAIEWSGNNSSFNSIPIAGLNENTTKINIQSTTAAEKNIFFSGYVNSYEQNAATCEIFITGSPTVAFTEKTGWIGFASKACTGMAIDQINGAKVIGNTIDTVLDSNSSERWGCQIILSENVIFENNLITRAGMRYLVLNASNHVVVRNNVLRSGNKLMVREAVTNNITVLGEDTSYPENVFANGSTAKPSGIYAAYPANSIGYNVGQPFNGCRWIVKDNTMAGVVGINTLGTYINGGAVFSDQFSRPETLGDNLGRTKLKHNNSTDGYDITVDIPSPVLDYSQKWNSATGVFAAYRFHADPSINTADSRIFDIAGGDEAYLYLKTYGSTTSNTLALGSKTFTISSPTLTNFLLATVPAGTFVRCTSGTAFVEGRVTTLVSPGSSAFTMLVTNAGGTGGPFTSWTIQFDTSALFVDRTSKLNLRSDVVLDYHTGTKIGTAATQKLGFWNTTPVVQPAAVADATNGATTQDRLNDLLARLRSIGIIAS
jgi:parallel beta-helix repeat protein